MTDIARARADMPPETDRILERRSLGNAHRRLAALLHPGLTVLDVGCGTGAITSGVAGSVDPGGLAVGIDVNEALLTLGRARRLERPVRFVRADVYALPFSRSFDIVTAARVVQWLARPFDAVTAMAAATKPGGRLVVLDYDHERIQWTPHPPQSMRRFYSAFLAWRAHAGFDNAIARRLPGLFASANLSQIEVTPQHESTVRGAEDFLPRAGIWADVAATRGHQMVSDGFLSEGERAMAEAEYRAWVESDAQSMTLYLEAVEGVTSR